MDTSHEKKCFDIHDEINEKASMIHVYTTRRHAVPVLNFYSLHYTDKGSLLLPSPILSHINYFYTNELFGQQFELPINSFFHSIFFHWISSHHKIALANYSIMEFHLFTTSMVTNISKIASAIIPVWNLSPSLIICWLLKSNYLSKSPQRKQIHHKIKFIYLQHQELPYQYESHMSFI